MPLSHDMRQERRPVKLRQCRVKWDGIAAENLMNFYGAARRQGKDLRDK